MPRQNSDASSQVIQRQQALSRWDNESGAAGPLMALADKAQVPIPEMSSADLVALNLAAPLTDGQEIYVLSVGEIPPAGYNNGLSGGGTPTVTNGQLVNINTASQTEMEQTLHVSSTTAQKIITYRVQHGPYTSIDQLLQVISKSIYDRIKNMVTV